MKVNCLIPAALIASVASSFGAAGIFDSFVFTTTTGTTPLAFYDIGATTINPDFAGNNLGTFTVGNTLFIGAQQKSFKNNFTDVTGHTLFWRVYSGAPSGSFQTVSMPFQFPIGGGGDQQWGGDSLGANSNPLEISPNVLSGLTNGTYSLQVYTTISTNGTNAASTIFNNVGGSNYTASFTIIPEPTSAALGLLGSVVLLRRRRI